MNLPGFLTVRKVIVIIKKSKLILIATIVVALFNLNRLVAWNSRALGSKTSKEAIAKNYEKFEYAGGYLTELMRRFVDKEYPFSS